MVSRCDRLRERLLHGQDLGFNRIQAWFAFDGGKWQAPLGSSRGPGYRGATATGNMR